MTAQSIAAIFITLMILTLMSSVYKAFWHFECIYKAEPERYMDYKNVFSLDLSPEFYNIDRVIVFLPWIAMQRIEHIDQQSRIVSKAKTALLIYRILILLSFTLIFLSWLAFS